MNLRSVSISLMTMAAALAVAGCKDVPGRPEAVAVRPDQVLNFDVLYKQNCAGCHGEEGKSGAAISLANPVYLAVAGADVIQKAAANGIPGTLMPAFAESQGGMLTDQQVAVLAQGVESRWGKANALGGQSAPPYASSSVGDPVQGQAAFGTFCAGCHGADGNGVTRGRMHTGSLVDPAYLALMTDQSLRSIIIAGQPYDGMPDWRSHKTAAGLTAMTDKEITDVVAWLTSHRVSEPGQPYTHP